MSFNYAKYMKLGDGLNWGLNWVGSLGSWVES